MTGNHPETERSQSPAAAGESASVALQHTIELARMAEQWGYHRFWVAEHHGPPTVGSSPEVLISYLLARTERIRLGSARGNAATLQPPTRWPRISNVLASLAPGTGLTWESAGGRAVCPAQPTPCGPQPTDSTGSVTLERKAGSSFGSFSTIGMTTPAPTRADRDTATAHPGRLVPLGRHRRQRGTGGQTAVALCICHVPERRRSRDGTGDGTPTAPFAVSPPTFSRNPCWPCRSS